ncbi:TIR domain-containing protein [Catellatospora tritici]|uniref:TIR domain-containing protein n=1 Tax=Catellatospora tritici TaxID=2851566 RepID=UPI001C2CCBA0|nr:TIR domain-containing protein [Catellatospora tritici]MBV1853429.1 TIR domain-containing protein [Catellatospora tritici]
MPEIFVNHRTTDTATMAYNIEKAIVEKFGARVVYRDNSSIPPGVHFEPHLWANLAVSKVILVLIGNHWLTPDSTGNIPLFAPKDFVRREIEKAKELNIRILPVLIGWTEDRINPDDHDAKLFAAGTGYVLHHDHRPVIEVRGACFVRRQVSGCGRSGGR